MNEKELRAAVQRLVLCELARTGQRCVPVMSSNRHVHLCQADVEKLFGAGYQLTKMRDLVQPGQFACNERVTIETEKGKMALRVVGPARKETQIELSFTDAVKLGLKPPIRMSGDLEGSPGCTLTNGDRRVTIPRGVIVAERHLHLAPDEAEAFGVKDGDVVSLVVEGPRPGTLDGVIVRSGKGHLMEAHIDKDEANACALSDGQLCRVIRKEDAPAVSNKRDICASVRSALAPTASCAQTADAPGSERRKPPPHYRRRCAHSGARRLQDHPLCARRHPDPPGPRRGLGEGRRAGTRDITTAGPMGRAFVRERTWH